MAKERLTIGELARRTGVSVKTLRFYSDEGLVPPSDRTRSGYRLYEQDALVRLDLVRSLREAGLGLDAIKKVLRRETSLADALRLRLAAVEAHVASLQRVAAALRAALRSEPNDDDVRRLCAVTRLSNEERKAVIESFYDRVAEGIPIEEKWKRKMIEASAPKLPDDPTPAQLDAWIELAEMLADPAFVANLRESAKQVWGKFDMEKMRVAGDAAAAAARDAIARGVSAESAEGKTVVTRFGEGLAAARGGTFDDKARAGLRDRFARHDPRASRYWELIARINGTPTDLLPLVGGGAIKADAPGTVREWAWIKDAVLHHLR